MQIFEYYFNPKNEEGKTFKSFIYEPKTPYEKRVGSFYLAGETKEGNSNLLERLSKNIKEKFYSLSSLSPEKSFPETLKRANEFLAEEVKKENVSWLGNLSCAILSMKDSNLNLTKTGNIKVLLIRSNTLTDIGKNLENEDIDPYPLKVFFNIVSGKTSSSDVIMIISEQVFSFIKEKGILSKILSLNEYNEKSIKEAFPNKIFTEGDGSKISGLCLMLVLDENISSPKEFSFQEKIKAIKPNKIKFNKNYLAIFIFILTLFIGFLIFKGENKNIGANQNESLVSEENDNIEIYGNQSIEEKNEIEPLFILDYYPEKIFSYNNEIFSFSPPSSLYNIGKDKIDLENSYQSISESPEGIFLISKEGILFSLKNKEIIKIDNNFNYLKVYGYNLYLLNRDNCDIIKYSLSNKKISSWFKEKRENQTCVSMAVDSYIWLLNKEGSIDLYYDGKYIKSLEIEEGVTEIKTSFNDPYLYLIHEKGKRIIIIDKEGNLIKQIKSNRFNEIKDILVSKEKKSILVLSENNIYEIDY